MAQQPAPTQNWLDRLRGGEMSVLAEVFGYYRPKLRQMVNLRIGSQLAARIDPSDVLQETYLEATRKIQAYAQDPQVSLFVWLRGLTWDRLSSLQREHLGTQRRAAQRELQLSEHSSVMLAKRLLGGITPSGALVNIELRNRVRGALDRLPSQDREVILMRHFEGMSNSEVAETLGLSHSAATMRHGRALARLRDALQSDRSDGGMS